MCGQRSSSTGAAHVSLVREWPCSSGTQWPLPRLLLGSPGADFIDTFQGRVF